MRGGGREKRRGGVRGFVECREAMPPSADSSFPDWRPRHRRRSVVPCLPPSAPCNLLAAGKSKAYKTSTNIPINTNLTKAVSCGNTSTGAGAMACAASSPRAARYARFT